jgi:hypothetical protein
MNLFIQYHSKYKNLILIILHFNPTADKAQNDTVYTNYFIKYYKLLEFSVKLYE